MDGAVLGLGQGVYSLLDFDPLEGDRAIFTFTESSAFHRNYTLRYTSSGLYQWPQAGWVIYTDAIAIAGNQADDFCVEDASEQWQYYDGENYIVDSTINVTC